MTPIRRFAGSAPGIFMGAILLLAAAMAGCQTPHPQPPRPPEHPRHPQHEYRSGYTSHYRAFAQSQSIGQNRIASTNAGIPATMVHNRAPDQPY